MVAPARRATWWCLALPLGLLLATTRCASADRAERSAPGQDSQDSGGCFGPGCGGAAGASGAGGSAGSRPEQELEGSFRAPVVTGTYVWTANPASDRVALIDAQQIAVRSFAVGHGPTYLAAAPVPARPELQRALVVNTKSQDASVLSVDGAGRVEVLSARLHRDANRWAVSSRGKVALAWTDAAEVGRADPIEGFQDVSVLELSGAAPKVTRLSVGYRPSRVVIANDERRAFVVTEAGLSVIELGGAASPFVSAELPLTQEPLASAAKLDVSITADGAWALVREPGASHVGVIALPGGARVTVQLSGPVTDLDLSADGTRAVAVVRSPASGSAGAAGAGGAAGASGSGGASAGAGGAAGASGGAAGASAGAGGAAGASGGAAGASGSGGASAGAGGVAGASAGAGGAGGASGAAGAGGGGGASGAGGASGSEGGSQVVVLPIPGIFSDPSGFEVRTLPEESFGSVVLGEQGNVALLYTNATPNDHLTILSTAPGASYLTHRTVALKAPVRAVFPTPDGRHAIALLAPSAGSTKVAAFSVVPLALALPPKIQGLDSEPLGVALNDERALITVRGATTSAAATYLVWLPELRVDALRLASPPLATGLVPAAGLGFVAQEHPEGRITFVGLADGKARTLTGFELDAKVVEGSP